MTEARERRLDALCEATGEATKSKALDAAVDTYLRLAGDSSAYPRGHLHTLLAAIDDNGGSLDGESIAEHLDTPALPVEYEETTSWGVGGDE
jgi:hypothetical protein